MFLSCQNAQRAVRKVRPFSLVVVIVLSDSDHLCRSPQSGESTGSGLTASGDKAGAA
jgi:hypothetical protein